MSSGSIPLLNGRVSRELKATVSTKGEASHLSAIKLYSDFFTVSESLTLTFRKCSYVVVNYTK